MLQLAHLLDHAVDHGLDVRVQLLDMIVLLGALQANDQTEQWRGNVKDGIACI
ncbi:hypothetical protein D3C79_1101740 [compost metagenome]